MDNLLNEEYTRIMKSWGSTTELFPKAQQEWIAFREGNCAHIAYARKTIQASANQTLTECKIIMTKNRLDEIQNIYLLNPENLIEKPCENAAFSKEIYFTDGQYSFPSIRRKVPDNTDASNIDFDLELTKRVNQPNTSYEVKVVASFKELPADTVNFTRHLIVYNLLSKTGELKNKPFDVALNSLKENNKFILYFHPLENKKDRLSEIRDVWSYGLYVEHKGGGRRNTVNRLLISKEGYILFGDDLDSYKWELGFAQTEAGDVLIDIITDPEKGFVSRDGPVMVTRYRYHPGDASLKKDKVLHEEIKQSQYWN